MRSVAGHERGADLRPNSAGRDGQPTSPGGRPDPPKLIVSDLDGTFLSSDGTVSPRNTEAVRAAAAVGIPTLFATGRPIRWLGVVADLGAAQPLVIASNGAVLYDVARAAVVDAQLIAVEVAADAVARIKHQLPEAAFGIESGEQVGYDDDYVLSHRLDRAEAASISRGRAEDLVRAGEFVKLLVQHPQLSSDELAARVATVVGDAMTVTHSAIAGFGLVEVSATGVSKASMLQRYCDRTGVNAADVAAFGDMPNDLEMLSWVGRPHVMAQAHPALDGLGAQRIGSNDESAVGETIISWLTGVGGD